MLRNKKKVLLFIFGGVAILMPIEESHVFGKIRCFVQQYNRYFASNHQMYVVDIWGLRGKDVRGHLLFAPILSLVHDEIHTYAVGTKKPPNVLPSWIMLQAHNSPRVLVFFASKDYRSLVCSHFRGEGLRATGVLSFSCHHFRGRDSRVTKCVISLFPTPWFWGRKMFLAYLSRKSSMVNVLSIARCFREMHGPLACWSKL